MFDPEEDSDPEEVDTDDLADTFDGVASVPPSFSSSMARAGAEIPARPCTSFTDLYARSAGLVRKKLSRRDIGYPTWVGSSGVGTSSPVDRKLRALVLSG